MKKSHYNALEAVFINEVNNALKPATWPRYPHQSKAKAYRELAADGMLREANVKAGRGWSAVTVTGWELTEAGRLAYCTECDGTEAA